MSDQKTCGECDRGRVPMFDGCGNEIGDEPCESCKGSGVVETSDRTTCPECGQPMLAEGQQRQHPDDYRHASGCPAIAEWATDTDRLNYLLQFIRIDDVGDAEPCKGVVVDNEAMDLQLGFGPIVDGRMECTVTEWNDDLRVVIDRAMVAHGFTNKPSNGKDEK